MINNLLGFYSDDELVLLLQKRLKDMTIPDPSTRSLLEEALCRLENKGGKKCSSGSSD